MEAKEAILERSFSPGTEAWIELWRHLRHDFVNHIQTIMGYVQINRQDRAVEYMKEVAAGLQAAGGILALGVMPVIACLILKAQELRQISVELQVRVSPQWNPSLWQGDRQARQLAEEALEAIDSMLTGRPGQDGGDILVLYFRGQPQLMDAYWQNSPK
ncbi:Spo0B domain-containing protein [Heliobacterium chlorum]|uniref:Spo0B domain-containing protein n=1 Tax=Heliobacterium chlorum TaxID=2698 RepID=A0ABR7SZM7_HELCL|nr:Spo0B domain-containing protein [Heliobacterium chlorum]MBC9783886.1 Spo0B domain-containing protein [Heliobacterium chlorum]